MPPRAKIESLQIAGGAIFQQLCLGVSVLVITDYLTKNHEYDYHHGNMHRSKRDILLNSLGLKTDIHHHIQPNEILHSVNVNDDIDLQGAHKNNSIKLIL